MAAALAAACLAGCGDDSEAEQQQLWDSCLRTESGCTCTRREGGAQQEYPPADDCSGYDCCLLHRSDNGSVATCTCMDLGSSESCEDHAGDSLMVVQQCPPAGELLSPSAMCIPEGGRCPNRSLESGGEPTSGCCEGLLCLSNGERDAENECQAAGGRDPIGAVRCERATLLGREELEIVSGTLATDRGELRFDSAQSTIAAVGPSCLVQLNMAFTASSAGDGGTCELVVDAVLFDGEWVVRRVLGALEGCDGYSGSESGSFDVRAASDIPFAFSQVTESCGAGHKLDANCVVGSFDWHFTGELAGITFEGSHLVAEGVVCSLDERTTCDELNP